MDPSRELFVDSFSEFSDLIDNIKFKRLNYHHTSRRIQVGHYLRRQIDRIHEIQEKSSDTTEATEDIKSSHH